MRFSKTGRKTSNVASAVARKAVLLKPNVANILNCCCEQKFIQHDPITIAVDCNGLSLLIFEEKMPNYVFGPKSAQNIDLFWVRRVFKLCVRVFCAPNATILLIYIPAQIKMIFMWKDDFFAKIGIFCKSIAGPHPSVVETYTQPYSFDGRMQLIFCNIKHELSVTIHGISTSWKKERYMADPIHVF